MKQLIERIIDLFAARGDSQYGQEAVTQCAHALQAAWLAEKAGANSALVTAALLHDVGHLLHDLDEFAPSQGIDDRHELLAASWLRRYFVDDVVEPVRLHVAAKRYLCTIDEGYLRTLSAPSQLSLQLQGGLMTAAEASAFAEGPHADNAVRLRCWDDAAKVVGLRTPSLEHFLPHITACTAARSESHDTL